MIQVQLFEGLGNFALSIGPEFIKRTNQMLPSESQNVWTQNTQEALGSPFQLSEFVQVTASFNLSSHAADEQLISWFPIFLEAWQSARIRRLHGLILNCYILYKGRSCLLKNSLRYKSCSLAYLCTHPSQESQQYGTMGQCGLPFSLLHLEDKIN